MTCPHCNDDVETVWKDGVILGIILGFLIGLMFGRNLIHSCLVTSGKKRHFGVTDILFAQQAMPQLKPYASILRNKANYIRR